MIKSFKTSGLFSILVLLLAGCGTEKKSDTIDIKGQAEISQGVKVINVLDKALYDDVHIKGSIHIPFGQVADKAKSENWNKNMPIVIYCSNYACTASASEAKKLKELGFNNVSVYEGGMAEWYQLSKKDSSYMVEGPAKQKYLKAPNEKFEQELPAGIRAITAQELKDLLGLTAEQTEESAPVEEMAVKAEMK
ncbi:rhodanese-like domain-containing protein [Candidatus Dependentiae bacterium]|nr:rhodanese-like domain-containing protein [Candidatus Dependentiae bacterium]